MLISAWCRKSKRCVLMLLPGRWRSERVYCEICLSQSSSPFSIDTNKYHVKRLLSIVAPEQQQLKWPNIRKNHVPLNRKLGESEWTWTESSLSICGYAAWTLFRAYTILGGFPIITPIGVFSRDYLKHRIHRPHPILAIVV